MLVDLPRTHHVQLYVVEEEIAKQTQNEPANEHVSEDVFEQAETKFMFIEPSTEPQVETFSEDVFGQCETEHCSEHYTEPAIEPHVEHPTEPLAEPAIEPHVEHPTEPLAEPQTESQTKFQTKPQDEPQTQPPTEPQTNPQTQTEPQVETISEANMEPEHEPSRFDDTEPDDSQDSEYNGSSRTDSVTSSFDDTDFSVEDVSQYHVDVEMDFEGHFGTEPSAARRRVESEFESDVSDSLHSVDESDSDSGIKKKKKKRLPEFNIATDMDNPDFKVGMIFSSREVLKEAIKNFSLQNKEFKNINLTSKTIAKKYLHLFVADRNLKPAALREAVMHDYVFPVCQSKCYRAREMALQINEGKHKSQYSRLYDYLVELRFSNPVTTTVCKLDDKVFERVYICLQACKEGFKACRPIICLDGCHLKGYDQGHILVAVGIDANDCIYPIAYAVIDSENNSSWSWFLEMLAEDLGLTNSYHGLLHTLAELFLHFESRTCVRHMYMNFKLKFTGKALKDALWKAARATYMREYEVALAEMNALSTKAHDWLVQKNPRNWSKSHFSCNSKCDMLLNNLCESFNKFILEARDKPIITLLEIIRTKIMQRIAKKKVEGNKWTTTLCPNIQQKLVASIERSNRCWTTHDGHFKYQVACGPHTQHAVDVEKHTCSCRIWQLTGIPCNHVVSAIFATDRIPDEFVDQYETCPPILPPILKRPPGRPKKNRREEADERDDHSAKVGKKGIKMTCTKCGRVGHNVRTCKGLVGGNSRLNRRQAQAQAQPSRGGALPKLPVKRPFGELATKLQQEVIPLISIQRAIKELQYSHQQSM
ncbi:hypothetical protein V6N13_123120 [Hibiscus sabdariffa]